MTPFILTGFPRTGTTVIAGSIIMHPDVLFYGEIFSNTPEVRRTEAARITLGAGWKFDQPLSCGMPPCAYNASTHPYLDKLFSRIDSFQALGFKIMYDQVSDGANSDVWKYISSHPEIKIIRTKRENLIEIVCSYVRASMTRRWHTTGDPIPSGHRFVVPANECLALMKRFDTLPEHMQNIEKSHAVLELDYERISTDFQACMSDITAFLGVKAGQVTPPRLKKIARLKPHEELANYEELKQHFKNTAYSRYFIE